MTTETLTRTVTPEVVSPMKPSVALRLGRLTRPVRLSEMYFDETTGACAVGAMVVGYGYAANETGQDIHDVETLLHAGIGWRDCPTCESAALSVSHLVDVHDCSDAQIVIWLEAQNL